MNTHTERHNTHRERHTRHGEAAEGGVAQTDTDARTERAPQIMIPGMKMRVQASVTVINRY